ncbi:uncharacterized membrane protein (DUF485 family) [Neorhizobium galegae]|uniref:hypothetical protein n=1 Tax=Neorhizobium galegae TaxID=399 RepID=UPI001AE1604C|nr:hypothetical protein [Neorhizobium galegae]MBP2560804.1 uncharacterized membrane protein (DUF485 family) [Neorhizobium galegae]
MASRDRISFQDLGWIVAYCFLGGWFVFLLLTGFFDQKLCTGAKDEQCLREWLSPLGTWAAILAGIPTAYYVARQVREAYHFQRENLRLGLRRDFSLARHVMTVCDSLKMRCELVATFWSLEEGHVPQLNPLEAFRSYLMLLKAAFDNQQFAEFEARIDRRAGRAWSDLLFDVDSRLQEVTDHISKIGDDEISPQEYRHYALTMLVICENLAGYADDCREIALDFIAYVEDAIGETRR